MVLVLVLVLVVLVVVVVLVVMAVVSTSGLIPPAAEPPRSPLSVPFDPDPLLLARPMLLTELLDRSIWIEALRPVRATTLTPPCDTNHRRRNCFTVALIVSFPPAVLRISACIASRSAATVAVASSDLTCSRAASMAWASLPSALIRSRKDWACTGDSTTSMWTSSG